MKNLKKVLALGLALVMMLGMFTIASAAETKKVATEFSDWASIEHKDAVSLMVDLGIINGKPDGTFDPKGTIDRASWAKMVYFAATGSDDADAYLGTTTNLKDIVGKTWAESYISYLAAMKYVSGDNNGNFNPTNNVTVAEANKMMLCVLGWDAEDRGYQNDAAWSGNIMTDAKREGLMENVDRAQTALVPLTRENAAQIVYNALRTKMVEGENGRDNGDKFIVKYNRKSYTLGYDVFSLIETTNIVKKLDDEGKAEFASTFVNGFTADGKISATLADVGQKVTVFFEGTQNYNNNGDLVTTLKKVVSSRVAGANNSPLKVLTGGVDWDVTFAKQVNGKDNDDYCGFQLQSILTGDKDIKNVTYYVNGVEKSTAAEADIKSGNVVELYDFKGDDGLIDTIKIYEYTAKKASGDVETRTSGGKQQIRIPGVVTSWTDPAKVVGYEGIEEGDVVLMYDNSKNYVIETPEKITGKVAKKSQDNKLTINGTKYAQSGLIADSATKVGEISDFASFDVEGNKSEEFDMYLDKNGDIVYGIQITEGTDKTKVAIVLDAWENFNGSDGSSVARTKLLFTDGTVETVDVSKIDGTKITSTNATTESTEIKNKAEVAFFNYKVDSNGKYELTEMANGADWANVEVDTNATDNLGIDQTAKFDGVNVANSKTLFIVAKGNDDDGYTYSTYTGFKNVPKMNVNNDALKVNGLVKGIAIAEKATDPMKYVYLKSTGFVGDGSDGLVYLVDAKYSIDTNDNYTINVVDAKGNKDELIVSAAVAQDRLKLNKEGQAPEVGKFFEIKSYDENSVVTGISDPTAATMALASIGNDIIKENDTSVSQYDDATVFVVIDLKAENDDHVNEFDSCGTFDPDNFEYSAGEEETDVYSSVKWIAVPADKTAEFVYVVRIAK